MTSNLVISPVQASTSEQVAVGRISNQQSQFEITSIECKVTGNENEEKSSRFRRVKINDTENTNGNNNNDYIRGRWKIRDYYLDDSSKTTNNDSAEVASKSTQCKFYLSLFFIAYNDLTSLILVQKQQPLINALSSTIKVAQQDKQISVNTTFEPLKTANELANNFSPPLATTTTATIKTNNTTILNVNTQQAPQSPPLVAPVPVIINKQQQTSVDIPSNANNVNIGSVNSVFQQQSLLQQVEQTNVNNNTNNNSSLPPVNQLNITLPVQQQQLVLNNNNSQTISTPILQQQPINFNQKQLLSSPKENAQQNSSLLTTTTTNTINELLNNATSSTKTPYNGDEDPFVKMFTSNKKDGESEKKNE